MHLNMGPKPSHEKGKVLWPAVDPNQDNFLFNLWPFFLKNNPGFRTGDTLDMRADGAGRFTVHVQNQSGRQPAVHPQRDVQCIFRFPIKPLE